MKNAEFTKFKEQFQATLSGAVNRELGLHPTQERIVLDMIGEAWVAIEGMPQDTLKTLRRIAQRANDTSPCFGNHRN